MITVGEVISRIRNQVKAVKQDAFLTDRFIFSLIKKHSKFLMRRQDSSNRVMKFNSVFQALDFVELIDVDRVQAGCHGLTSGCYFKRSKEKLPAMMEGYWGPIIRAVTSLDLTEQLTPTYPSTFEQIASQKTFKYNKKKYYWFLDGYLYFPNLAWDAVRIEGVFEDDISKYNCDPGDDCLYAQDRVFSVPEFLYTELEQFVLKDLGIMLQIPQDIAHDNKHIIR